MRIASWYTRGLRIKSRSRMAGAFVYSFQIQLLATQESMVKVGSQPILNEFGNTVTTVSFFLTSIVPFCIRFLLSPVTGDSTLTPILPSVNSRMGSIALVLTEDICKAHLFLMEHDQAHGRYICCTDSFTLSQLVHHFSKVYLSLNSQRVVETKDESVPAEISSKKLKDLGFKYKYNLQEVIHQTVEYCIDYGLLLSSREHTKGVHCHFGA
ncbi:putative anthocyanidin reductase [Rutidosis leptorrhynchoides]|uniref:putative anthocyanidin reductase n=1 Tax=Rutidosis leptorrhynchoides TaxID=125765 RepID=UPI003A99238E